MSNVNFLKPNKENLNLFLFLGSIFFVLGLIDFCLNNFYEKNITSFLPSFVSFFTPLIFGMIGLYLIRIELKTMIKRGKELTSYLHFIYLSSLSTQRQQSKNLMKTE